MSITPGPVVRFNTQLMAEDAAARGLSKLEWAKKAGCSDMSVIRFLRSERQTAKTFTKLCRALGQKPERYLIRLGDAVEPESVAS